MKLDRILISAVLCIAAGLTWLGNSLHGTMGLSAAYPIAGTSLRVDATVTGWAALGGTILTLIGVVLLLAAFIMAIVNRMELPHKQIAH